VTIDQAIVLHVSYLVLIIKYIDKYMPTKTLKRRQHWSQQTKTAADWSSVRWNETDVWRP